MPKSVLRGGVCGNIGETGDIYNFFPLSPKNSLMEKKAKIKEGKGP